jgi:hypothetical protein
MEQSRFPLSVPISLYSVCLDLYNYPTDFDAFFLIDRAIQEEGLYVNYFSISIVIVVQVIIT